MLLPIIIIGIAITVTIALLLVFAGIPVHQLNVDLQKELDLADIEAGLLTVLALGFSKMLKAVSKEAATLMQNISSAQKNQDIIAMHLKLSIACGFGINFAFYLMQELDREIIRGRNSYINLCLNTNIEENKIIVCGEGFKILVGTLETLLGQINEMLLSARELRAKLDIFKLDLAVNALQFSKTGLTSLGWANQLKPHAVGYYHSEEHEEYIDDFSRILWDLSGNLVSKIPKMKIEKVGLGKYSIYVNLDVDPIAEIITSTLDARSETVKPAYNIGDGTEADYKKFTIEAQPHSTQDRAANRILKELPENGYKLIMRVSELKCQDICGVVQL